MVIVLVIVELVLIVEILFVTAVKHVVIVRLIVELVLYVVIIHVVVVKHVRVVKVIVESARQNLLHVHHRLPQLLPLVGL